MAIMGNFSRSKPGGRFATAPAVNASANFRMPSGAADALKQAQNPTGYYGRRSVNMAVEAGAIRGKAAVSVTGSVSAAAETIGAGLATIAIAAAGLGTLEVVGSGNATIVVDGGGEIAGDAMGAGVATISMDGTAEIYGDGEMAGAAAISLDGNAEIYGDGFMSGSTANVEEMSADSIAAAVWAAQAEGGLSTKEVLRVLLAVAAGKTTITNLGGGNASVAFRDQGDTANRILAYISASERTSVTLNV